MKVILVNEDCHGLIGLAADYPRAVDFLIKTGWLYDDTEVWVDESECFLKDALPNWREEIKNWDIEKFNEFFCCIFWLQSVEVYGS